MGLGRLSIRTGSGQLSTVYIVALCALELVLFPHHTSPYGSDNFDNLDEVLVQQLMPKMEICGGSLPVLERVFPDLCIIPHLFLGEL